MTEMLVAMGLMSGTSMDGIDAALIRTDGEKALEIVGHHGRRYSASERTLIQLALEEAASLKISNPKARTPAMLEAEQNVTELHVQVIMELAEKLNLSPNAIDIVGFHGQTVLHRPEDKLTIQLGDGEKLAERTGIDIIYDFRTDDVSAGGQGAPLVPIYHAALVSQSSLELPVVVVNLGGVGNVTWIDSEDELLAFDFGPGNGLIDDWVGARTDLAYDIDGQIASSGRPNHKILTKLLQHPFFNLSSPKSLDRKEFDPNLLKDLMLADGAATLTMFTAKALSLACSQFPKPAKFWIISGGGRHNPVLMNNIERELTNQLGEVRVHQADQLGWNGDFIEAEAFAYLAVRSLRKLPITFPKTTGVKTPISGGRLVPAST